MQTGLWLPRSAAPPPVIRVIRVPFCPCPPQEFVQLAKRLLSDPALEEGLAAQGREYVRTCHSWQMERATYQHLVRTLVGGAED